MVVNVLRKIKRTLICHYHTFIYKFGIYLYNNIFVHLPIIDHLIMFESEGDFCDNSWALYQYLRKKNTYKFVWIVKYPEKYSNTEDTIFVSRYKHNRIRSYYYCSRAKYSFYTHWTFQEITFRKQQTIVKLAHGCGMIKNAKGNSKDYFDLAVLSGKAPLDYYMNIYNRKEDVFLPLGLARNDLLIHNIGNGHDNPFCKNRDFKKLILWMPTFRKSVNSKLSESLTDTDTGLPLIETVGDLQNLDTYLTKNDIIILIKIHHLQAEKEVFKKNFNNIIILTDKQLDELSIQLYEIVGKTDALITDYSGISFDYLLTDKPIGYILYDIENYEKSRGFFYDDIRPLLPGLHIYNKDDLHTFFNDVLKGNDIYKDARKVLREKVHISDKGDACERTCNFFNL